MGWGTLPLVSSTKSRRGSHHGPTALRELLVGGCGCWQRGRKAFNLVPASARDAAKTAQSSPHKSLPCRELCAHSHVLLLPGNALREMLSTCAPSCALGGGFCCSAVLHEDGQPYCATQLSLRMALGQSHGGQGGRKALRTMQNFAKISVRKQNEQKVNSLSTCPKQ